MSTSTSTFELYIFSRKINPTSLQELAAVNVFSKQSRHSGYRLVEKITTTDDKGKVISSYKIRTVDLGQDPNSGALAMPEDGRDQSKEGIEIGGLFLLKGEEKFAYAQTQVVFDNDPDKNSTMATMMFEKILLSAKLINSANKILKDQNLFTYAPLKNNCDGWTAYTGYHVLQQGGVVDLSHIGASTGRFSLLSDSDKDNPLSREADKIIGAFNRMVFPFSCPTPSDVVWDSSQITGGILELNYKIGERNAIITNDKNYTNTSNNLNISLTGDNYKFKNEGSYVSIFAGANEGVIKNSGNYCAIETNLASDYIFNTGDSVKIVSGIGDDLIINEGNNVTISGGEGADRIIDISGGSSTISLGEDNENDMLILRKPANSSTNVTGASAEDILALYGGNTEPVFAISGGNIVITLGDGSTVTIENGVSVRPDRIYINGKVYISDDDECYREYDSNSDGDLPSTPLIIEILNHSDAILSKIDLAENSVPVLIDPLVLDMDGDGIEIVGASSSNAYFDLTGNGFATRNDWLGGDDTLSGGAGQIGRIAA